MKHLHSAKNIVIPNYWPPWLKTFDQRNLPQKSKTEENIKIIFEVLSSLNSIYTGGIPSVVCVCVYRQTHDILSQNLCECTSVFFSDLIWGERTSQHKIGQKSLHPDNTIHENKPLSGIGASGKVLSRQHKRCKSHRLDPWIGKISSRRTFQYSCLENPMVRETWQTIVHRCAKSWNLVKLLSTHDTMPNFIRYSSISIM